MTNVHRCQPKTICKTWMSIFENYQYNLFDSCFTVTSIRWVCIYDDAGCLLWSAVQWVEGSDWATPLTPVERQLVLTTKFWVCWNDATSARNTKSISVSRPKCVGSNQSCDFEFRYANFGSGIPSAVLIGLAWPIDGRSVWLQST